MATVEKLEKEKQAIESSVTAKKTELGKAKKADKELVQSELDAISAQLRDTILRLDASIADVINHMQANIDRMEREGTTSAPPLDRMSPDNAGKTQYEIDKAILAEYQAKRDSLASQYPEVFRTEVIEAEQ